MLIRLRAQFVVLSKASDLCYFLSWQLCVVVLASQDLLLDLLFDTAASRHLLVHLSEGLLRKVNKEGRVGLEALWIKGSTGALLLLLSVLLWR